MRTIHTQNFIDLGAIDSEKISLHCSIITLSPNTESRAITQSKINFRKFPSKLINGTMQTIHTLNFIYLGANVSEKISPHYIIFTLSPNTESRAITQSKINFREFPSNLINGTMRTIHTQNFIDLGAIVSEKFSPLWPTEGRTDGRTDKRTTIYPTYFVVGV